MPKDINKIAKASSKRLADTITAKLADEVIRQKTIGGPFTSWENLKNRVDGLGVKKIQSLKDAGFIIHEASVASDDDKNDYDNGISLSSLRAPVHDMEDQT